VRRSSGGEKRKMHSTGEGKLNRTDEGQKVPEKGMGGNGDDTPGDTSSREKKEERKEKSVDAVRYCKMKN